MGSGASEMTIFLGIAIYVVGAAFGYVICALLDANERSNDDEDR